MSELLALAAMLRELASLPGLVVLVPLAAAAGLAWVPQPRLAAALGAAAATAAFLLACALPLRPVAGLLLLVDPLAAHIAILTGFVGAAAACSVAATPASERPAGRAGPALFQASLGCLLLALLSNNALVTWGAIAAACIGSVGVVGLPGTPHAKAAAFRQLMLCGVGIALAFLGTMLLWLAAAPALGPGLPAMSWSRLATAPGCNAAMLNLAFVFLLLGYATKAGLAPLHAWLTEACAEAPTPVAAVLTGSLLNVALLVILRLRGVLNANAAAIAPGPAIVALGLASVLLAAFSLWRRRDAQRFFAFSAIGQSGLAAFAFGLGGAAATFAGLLHLTGHTLTHAAIFQCVGHAARLKGSQRFSDIGGLLARHRALGLTLAAGMVALAGLPPFALFTSEFLIVVQAVRDLPGVVPLLALGLVATAWALFRRLVSLCAGEATPDRGPAPDLAALLPAWLPLAVVLVLGLAMPGPIAGWFAAIAGAAR